MIAIAHAFNISPIAIFRTAGLLPNNGDDQIKFDDWQYLLSQMTEDEQEEVRIAELIELLKKNNYRCFDFISLPLPFNAASI